MPQDLVELTISDQCDECSGGIANVAAVDCGYIDIPSTTVNSDKQITLVVASTPGKVVELAFDDDDTSKYDSVGERSGKIHRNNQELFGKAACLNLDKVVAGEALKSSCCLILAIRYNNGMEVVQGLDVVRDGVGYKAVKSKTAAQATVSALSDTGANEDRLEVKVNSVSRNVLTPFADPSTFGYDAFIGL